MNTYNFKGLTALELNCLQVAVDDLIESQQTFFSDIVDSEHNCDREHIRDVAERLIALNVLKLKLQFIQGGAL